MSTLKTLLAVVVSLSLLLTACSGPTPPATPTELSSVPVSYPPPHTASPTAPPAPTAVPSSPTATPEPPDLTPTAIAAAEAPSATPSSAPATSTRSATARPSATSAPPTSTRTATPVPPSPTRAATPTAVPRQASHVVFGYYVPYDVTSWLTLEAQADRLDYLAVQWVGVDPCGGITSRDDHTLVAFARAHGIRILPTLLTSDQPLNHRLLTDPEARARAIADIVAYVMDEGYDGFDLDLENVPAGDRAAYTSFVAELSAALHARGKVFSAALPAKPYDATTGWTGAYDYAAVGPYLDYAMMMTYAYTTAASRPGSTAPYDWVDQVMAFVTSQIPADKVLLGVAFYGYDWNTTMGGRARALRYSQAAALAGQYGSKIVLDPASRSATFGYSAKLGDVPPPSDPLPTLNHDIGVRKPPVCTRPLPTPTPLPRPTVTPKPTPTPAPLQQHAVWLEDAASVAARLDLADKYGAAGIGAWRLGQEDPAVWPILDHWR